MIKMEELQNIYSLPAENDPRYAEKKAMLLWYYDVWLVALAGLDMFGDHERCYKRATKASSIRYNGNLIPLVTIEAEAFGLLMLQNCYPKWQHIVPMKAKHGSNWAVPKLNKNTPETKKYHATLWSDPKAGKDQGGGWDPVAYESFKGHIQAVQKMRQLDKKNKHAIHEMCLKFVRAKHNVTDVEYVPKSSRKRKRAKNVNLAPMVNLDLEAFEVEDDFSVGSETSSGEK